MITQQQLVKQPGIKIIKETGDEPRETARNLEEKINTTCLIPEENILRVSHELRVYHNVISTKTLNHWSKEGELKNCLLNNYTKLTLLPNNEYVKNQLKQYIKKEE